MTIPLRKLTVRDVSTGKLIEFMVIDGEPYIPCARRLPGWLADKALNAQAIKIFPFGKDKRIEGFIRLAWLAEAYPEYHADVMEMRRNLLALHSKCASLPSGRSKIIF